MRQIESLEAEIEELETQSQAISEKCWKPTMLKTHGISDRTGQN